MKYHWKQFLAIAVVAALGAVTSSTARAQPPIAYYAFDGDFEDRSGNDFNAEGFEVGFVSDTERGDVADFGDFNNGAYVLLPEEFSTGDNGFNTIVDSQNFTVSFWMNRLGDGSQSQWTMLFGGSRQIGSHAGWGDGNVYFDVAGCCDGSQRIATSLGGADTDGAWHHLAYVKRKDGTDLAATAVYLDGQVLVSSIGWDDGGDPPIADVVEIDAASIGADNGGGSSQTGLMDDFAIWNVALDPGQILALAEGAPVVGEDVYDFNGDGVVNLDDYTILTSNFSERFAFGESQSMGDVNGDLRVNLKDFLAFRTQWNAPAGAQAVPEPSSLALLGLAACGLLGIRRRRR